MSNPPPAVQHDPAPGATPSGIGSHSPITSFCRSTVSNWIAVPSASERRPIAIAPGLVDDQELGLGEVGRRSAFAVGSFRTLYGTAFALEKAPFPTPAFAFKVLAFEVPRRFRYTSMLQTWPLVSKPWMRIALHLWFHAS